MTIAELKTLIAGLPDHMEVYVYDEEAEFSCRPAEKAKVLNVQFREDSSTPEPMAEEQAFVITPL